MNHKQGTFRFPKAFAGILLALALVLSLVPVAARAADEEGTETPAAPTAGWESEVLDFTGTIPETGWMYYYSNGIDFMYEHAGAYVEVAEGEGVDGGDALHAARLEGAPSQVVLYSYHAEATPGATYRFSAKIRLEGEGTTLGFTFNGIDENGVEVAGEQGYSNSLSSLMQPQDGVWQEVAFTFTVSNATTGVGAKFQFNNGIGDVYIDDVQLQQVTVPEGPTGLSNPANKWYTGSWTAAGAVASVNAGVTKENICTSDSSDGDGASLELMTDHVYVVEFPKIMQDGLPVTLSLKYKNIGTNGAYDGGVYMKTDLYTDAECQNRAWNIINPDSVDGSLHTNNQASDWLTFETTFYSVANSTGYIMFGAQYGAHYLMDEVSLKINGVELIPNGSFASNITTNGIALGKQANVVIQPTGEGDAYGFILCNKSDFYPTDCPSTLTIDTSAYPEQTYDISFDMVGGDSAAGAAYLTIKTGDTALKTMSTGADGGSVNYNWQTVTLEDVTLGDTLVFEGPNNFSGGVYIRNISIIGADDTDYAPAAPAVFDPEEEVDPVYGTDIFAEYGQFENLAVSDTSWTFEGGARVVGFHHEGTNDAQYTLGIYGNGKATSPAVALDAPAAEGTYARIAVVMGTEGDLNVTLVTNDGTVLTPSAERTTENMYEETVSFFGQYAVPAGTTSLQIVLQNESEQYISVSHVRAVNGGLMLQTHVHAFVADDDADHPLQTVEATCQHGGSVSRYCTVCEDYVVISSTEKTDHHYVEDQVLQEPTCAQSGRVQEKCEYCGATRITPVPATGEHTYENGVCTVCGAADPNYTPDPGNPGTEDPGKEDPDPGQPGTEDPGNEGEGGCSGTVNGWYALAAVPVLAAAILLFKKRANK